VTNSPAAIHAIRALRRKFVERRETLGLTQAELAVRMRVDRTYVTHIERDERGVQWTTVVNWATGLDYDITFTEHERQRP
jgi:transcriptional regulator with XRE-family HTH domain